MWSVAFNATQGEAGDAIAGSLRIAHAAGSSAPAYAVRVASLLPFLDMLPVQVSRSVTNNTMADGWAALANIDKVIIRVN